MPNNTNTTADHDHDHISPQSVLLNMCNPSPRRQNRWRQIFLILHARKVLISIADNAKMRSLSLPGVSLSSPSYTILQTHNVDAGEVTQNSAIQSDISLDIHDNNGPFRISCESLAQIVKEKNLVSLSEHGGVEGIAAALDTNLENGIHGEAEDLSRQQAFFGFNRYWETPAPVKGFFHFVSKSLKDCTVLLLLCCAALSLGSGIKEEGKKDGWYDGATIFIAVFILVVVTSLSNYYRARKLQKLLNKNTIAIKVLRDGWLQEIPVSDVVVGDIVCLKKGDRVPADGLLLNGQPLQVDEVLDSSIDHDQNPFLFSGAKVLNGFACMLVTTVGMKTWGEMMSSGSHDPNKKTLLQARLDKLNSYVQNTGLFLATLILLVLLLRYLLGKQDDETGYPDLVGKRTAMGELTKAIERLIVKPRGKASILTTTLAILLVGIQEGLPFIVIISLSYWNGRMVSDQAIIQELSACVTMGLVTTICTDKTGGLTLNKVEVDKFWIGEEVINEEVISVIAPNVLETLCDGVGTPFVVAETSSSPTEDPLLHWAELKLGMDMEVLKQKHTILNAKSFNSDMKRSGLLMRNNGGIEKNIHLHWKGAAESILAMCSHYYKSNGIIESMDEQKRTVFERIIQDMATNGVQSIAFAYKQIKEDDGDSVADTAILQEDGLILLGVVGLRYPCQPEARRAVEAFIHAGVRIKLVSADHLSIVKAIAIECGILRPNQDINAEVLEGEQFRNLSEEERMEMIDRISVMGSSLPSDKLLMVQCLRQKGHVVAVTEASTSDSPVLKEADVGLSMGARLSETAKESSKIVILDGSFTSITTVLTSGRCAYKNILKFIQLELTMTIAGLLINSISTVSLGEAPITPLQLFWVNLIVGTLGALALLTEPPSQKLMEMPPVCRTEPLITNSMWRNIIIQAFYQAAVLLTFQFKGQALPGMNQKVKKAMIFNGFVLFQVFNQFNARQLEKKNVFKGIIQNHWFLVAVGVQVVFQVVVVEFAKSFAGTTRLNWDQWLACILAAIISWPIDWAVKCVPFPINQANRSLGSHIGFTSTTPSAPLVSQSQLGLPLIRGESTSVSS